MPPIKKRALQASRRLGEDPMENVRVPRAINARALFWTGCMALFTAGVSASLRSAIAGAVKTQYIDRIDLAHSAGMVGAALGVAFLGWSIMLLVCSLTLEKVGMKAMLMFASVTFIIATFIIMFCGQLAHGPAVYSVFYGGIFLNGIGWGGIEGTVNPLVAALYPKDVTGPMNHLHAWWPAGLVAGALFGVFAAHWGLDWRWIIALVPCLSVLLGVMVLTQRFPETVSAAMGVSAKDRFMEAVRRPSFLIWMMLMLLTSASELSPGQWVDVSLSNVVGMRGVLLLAYVSGIQFVGRHFAGPLAHRLSAEGLLMVSSVLAGIGLYALSFSHTPASAVLAATAWGLGICYLWPTMVATVAERYPRGGAWTVGLMGVAGAISNYFVLPILGRVYDAAAAHASGGQPLSSLSGQQLASVQAYAAGQSFKAVALIPAVLVVAFGILWTLHRSAARRAYSATAEVRPAN